jgi:short-subunit dehydrogenase
MPGGAVYSGTKGFVSNFTEALWYENKARDVYLMTLLPGVTKTNFQQVAGNGKYNLKNDQGDPPEVIVNEALQALKERKIPVLVSGPKYRYLLFWAKRLFSKKQQISLIANFSPAMD